MATTRVRTCAKCHAPLGQGVSFCEACGQSVETTSRPASSGGASFRGILGRIGLCLVGLILLLAGLRGPLLSVVGESASATVTDVKEDRSRNSKATDHNYVVRYEFRSGRGETATGSYSLARVYDATTLPRRGTGLRVLYLGAWPSLNLSGAEATPDLLGVGLAALGVLLVAVGLRRTT